MKKDRKAFNRDAVKLKIKHKPGTMKKINAANFKKDKHYQAVTRTVHGILKHQNYVAPVEVFMHLGKLSLKNYEDWRSGRIPTLEDVIECNLSKAHRILSILKLHAREQGLKPSKTVYKTWGKGKKVRLRFSKYGHPQVEAQYSTHYVSTPKIKFDENKLENHRANISR